MSTDPNLDGWLAALSDETKAIWIAHQAILEPLRWCGGQPDPIRVEALPHLLAVYEAFVRPRLADFKLFSGGRVLGRTVDSAHDAYLVIARGIHEALQAWPTERPTQEAKERAAILVSRLTGILPALAHEAERMPAQPLRRLRCIPDDHSVWLDGKRIAEGLDSEVFAFVSLLNASYPDLMTFPAMQNLSVDLNGVNQSRIKKRMPRNLANLVKPIRGRGHVLKLPTKLR